MHGAMDLGVAPAAEVNGNVLAWCGNSGGTRFGDSHGYHGRRSSGGSAPV